MTLDRKPTPEGLEKIAAGCEMDGGAPGGTGRVFVQPVAVIRDDTDASKQTRVRVVVAEGRNREVGGWVGGWVVAAWHGVGWPTSLCLFCMWQHASLLSASQLRPARLRSHCCSCPLPPPPFVLPLPPAPARAGAQPGGECWVRGEDAAAGAHRRLPPAPQPPLWRIYGAAALGGAPRAQRGRRQDGVSSTRRHSHVGLQQAACGRQAVQQ